MATKLHIVIVNPRMYSLAKAAQYIGVSVKKFHLNCDVQPVEFADGSKRYDRNALDAFLDRLSDGNEESDEELIAKLS
jgi:hypothetical protein